VSAPVPPIHVAVDPLSLEVPPEPGRPMVTVPEGGPPLRGPVPKRPPVPDSTVQLHEGGDAILSVAPPGLISDPDVNVAGLTAAANPPDTVGDVGPNHFVQMVNATFFQVWDKQGNPLTGARAFNLLWPTGEICDSSAGDPIVVYDHMADRWLLSQFADPNHMCVAISQTPDPTAGTWFLYTFDVGVFPDYPKFGVWPDGYYMSSYEFPNLGVYAFDRANMLLGNAAAFMKSTLPALGAPGVRDTRVLPGDLDGPPPPDGTPNFFLRTVDDQQDPGNPQDRIEVYNFSVNWGVPSFTFALSSTLLPAAFDIMTCNRNAGGVRDCIPQPDTTATVDALSNRPMMQLKYRRIGGVHAMVVNQTIDVAGSIPNSLPFTPAEEVAGIRWYELRNSGAGWTIRQQGTYAPQPLAADTEDELRHRWMGSMAMDKDGNIALGYSIVNDDDDAGEELFPGIAYTGRRFNDVLNLLPQGERTIRSGTNSQTGDFGQRWGDYSALSVDPVDDCTFWYTNHVAGTGGAGPRPTRIASFRFDTCGTDLRIAKRAEPDPAIAGERLGYTITVTNGGPLDATGVTVVDVLPSGAAYVADTGSCVQAPVGTLTCGLGPLAAGETRSFRVEVRLASDLTSGGPTFITNTARVGADQFELDDTDNEARVTTIVDERADLKVTKLCKPDHPVLAGEKATCTILVDNHGASLAREVVLDDVLVAIGGFSVQGIVASQGTCSEQAGPPRRITCDLGPLDAGAQAVVVYDLTADEAVDVNNVAWVKSDTPDPVLSNNQASASVSFLSAADLWMEKEGVVKKECHDRDVRYTLTVHNDGPGCTVGDPKVCGKGGPSDAKNVRVVDRLPLTPKALRVENVSPGCIYDPGAHQVVCEAALVPAGASVQFWIKAELKDKAKELVNEASVSSATADPDTTNNTHRIVTKVGHH
jgi:uncharacterized repeat protein (TIGR01451 family)